MNSEKSKDCICEDIVHACEIMCFECFKLFFKDFETDDDMLQILSLAIEWEFEEGIEYILSSSRHCIDLNKTDFFTHITIFEKVCMVGNAKCVQKFLDLGTIKESSVGISSIISNPNISSILNEWKDVLNIKTPEDFELIF